MAIQTLFGGQPYLPTGVEAGKVQPQVARAAAHPERPDFTEYGASGTPIFGGFLRERGEYNPDLTGLAAVYTYEQMRRSDAQVAATLQAIKLPILAATWDVRVPREASAVEREAAEFVRQVFFEDLNFTSILRNALLELDFGFAVHEDVWVATGNRIRLAKLAPRLPITAYRWLTDESGENLAALEQMGYRGAEYLVTQIPANKMDVFTFNQEGQNYTGLALLRPMYQHWYIKGNLYKVDAISCERNGMGVPTLTMGEDAKHEDRENALGWVQALITHERTGLVLPHGWTFELVAPKGTIREAKDSIAHHNMAISMAGLAMFLMLGETAHGSRALGVSMSDFFLLSLEATARQIARTLNLGTVKRLVDYNFSGIQHYPQLVPQQMLTLKFDAVVEALNKLAQFGVIAPDDRLESWMREKMGAPEPEKRRGEAEGTGQEPPDSSREAEAPIPADGAEEIGAPAEGGDGGVDAESGAALPAPELVEAAAQIIQQAMREGARQGGRHA
jgi:phage gp29-like protein